VTDWQAVKDADYAVPVGVEIRPLVEELAAMLASPDPTQRDELGLSILATWLSRGLLDQTLCHWLGDEMAVRLGSNDIWTRTFAPLILDVLVSGGVFERSWLTAFERWYPSETDLRGKDPALGWLHAVAHGADLLGTLGRCPEVEPARILDVAARRLSAHTQIAWQDGEDERLGYAIGLTLTRPDLSGADSVAWVDLVEKSWTDREPAPPPPWVGNASRTLRVVLGLTLTGTRPSGAADPVGLTHATEVQDRLLVALRTLTPYMW